MNAAEPKSWLPPPARRDGGGALLDLGVYPVSFGDFYAPTSFTLISRTGKRTHFDGPHETRGLWHQADEVARCLREGLLESPLMPLDESVSIMQTMDAVLAQGKS